MAPQKKERMPTFDKVLYCPNRAYSGRDVPWSDFAIKTERGGRKTEEDVQVEFRSAGSPHGVPAQELKRVFRSKPEQLLLLWIYKRSRLVCAQRQISTEKFFVLSKTAQALEWNNKGHKKYINVDFDDAIADYTQALKLCPDLAVAYYNRGTVHYRMGDFQLALEDLNTAVKLEPENSEYRQGFQECQRLMQERNKAWTPLNEKTTDSAQKS